MLGMAGLGVICLAPSEHRQDELSSLGSSVAIVTSMVDAARHVIMVGWIILLIIVRFLLKIKSSKASSLWFISLGSPKGAPCICFAAD